MLLGYSLIMILGWRLRCRSKVLVLVEDRQRTKDYSSSNLLYIKVLAGLCQHCILSVVTKLLHMFLPTTITLVTHPCDLLFQVMQPL